MAAMGPLSPLDGMKPDPDLWFDDGNVVVVAQQTAFRFHRGALSRHSEIFRDMFGVPQPTNPEVSAQNMHDGCPIINVTDSAYDFKHLLRAVYDGASVFSASGPMEFGVLASIVRMGHKYQVETILEEALRRLKTIFTSDFSTWDRHQGKSTNIVTLRNEDAIEAVNLAQLTGRTEMLASAFYMCGVLEVDTLFSGVTRADGTLEQLSTYDLQRCLSGQMALIKHDAQSMAELFHAEIPETCLCRSHGVRRATMQSRYAELASEIADVLDPLPIHHGYLSDIIDDLQADELICGPCADAMRAELTVFRRELWDCLPGLFRL